MLALNAEEAGLINDALLNTAEAKHYAAVLLSQLRQIKAANNVVDAAMTGVLNQNAGDGGPGEAARNWLLAVSNEAAINANLQTVTDAQLKVLEEYAAAHGTDATAGKGLA